MTKNPFVFTVTLLGGLLLLVTAGWSLGAFQLGLGVALLLALIWADALATALAGLLAANAVHAASHFADLDADAWGILLAALVTAAVLWVRLRELGFVVGAVATATGPALAPFVRQKTVTLTTYRRDGRPGASPVSIAVEGDHAYVRSFEKSLKTRRLRRDPRVEVAPSTARGRATGPGVRGRMRLLDGAEARHAAHVLTAKHPLLHGVLVPLTHRLARAKTGRTVHFELVPTGSAGREMDHEAAALLDVVHGHPAAVRLDQAAHDGQP